jgi:hypothetical protein
MTCLHRQPEWVASGGTVPPASPPASPSAPVSAEAPYEPPDSEFPQPLHPVLSGNPLHLYGAPPPSRGAPPSVHTGVRSHDVRCWRARGGSPGAKQARLQPCTSCPLGNSNLDMRSHAAREGVLLPAWLHKRLHLLLSSTGHLTTYCKRPQHAGWQPICLLEHQKQVVQARGC